MLANRAILFFSLGLIGLLLALFGLTFWLYRRGRLKHDFYRDIAAVGILLGLVGGFFWRPLFEAGVTMPRGGGDLVSFFFPLHAFASDNLRAGQLPLWNPHLFGGMPFAADIQSGLFYPLNWLFWLAGEITYPKVQMYALVHYWLAGSFMYAFVRSLNVGRWGGLVAGTLYAFGGFAVSHLGHLPMLAVAAWFPLVLLAVNQAARPQARRGANLAWAVASGLLLALCFLVGHFQLFVYNFYGAAIFWAAVAWRGRQVPVRRYWLGQILRSGIAGLLVLGGALVQLLPFYEMGQLSVRSAINYEISTQFGVEPIGLVDLLLPNLFSPNPQEYFGYWSSSDVLGYMGVAVYALALWGVLLRPAERSRFYPVFFLCFGAAGLILALSGATILQGWLYQFVPALNLTRASGRFLYWFNAGFAVAAAFGLQNWLDYRARPSEPSAEKVMKWSWRGYALAALALLVVPVPLLYAEVLKTPGEINELIRRGINGLVFAIIVAGLAAVLLRLYARRLLLPDFAAVLLLALLIFDLFSARATFNPAVGDVASGFDHAETLKFLKSQDALGQYRMDASTGSVQQAWQANTAQVAGVYDVRGVFNPLQLASYEVFWNAVTSAQKDFRALPAYTLLSARYVVARNKEDPTGPQFKLVHRDDRAGIKLNVWENSQALPKAFVLHRSEVKPDAEALALLTKPDFKPTELLYLAGGRNLSGATSATPAETVRLTGQSANRLTFEANLETEGYIFISQPFYPGWRARANNQDVKLEKANYTFSAVYLPAGKHNLALDFEPPTLFYALPVTLVTWLGGLIYLTVYLFRRKPPPVVTTA